MKNQIVIGIDVGGSHITAGIVDLEARKLQEKRLMRCPVDSKGEEEMILEQWCEAIVPLVPELGLESLRLGIAMPGPFDYDAGISFIGSTQDKYEALYGKNIKELLASKLGIKTSQIRFKNDAACFLQGELFAGSAQGFKRAIGMTLGTGAGTAFFHGTEAHDAARWGDSFKEGIAEQYFSSRWFLQKYHELTGKEIIGVRDLAELEDLPLKTAIFTEFGQNLGLFLSRFASEEEAEVVVLGGSITHSSDLFMAEVKSQVARECENVSIRKSLLGEQAALIGAASCWYESIS